MSWLATFYVGFGTFVVLSPERWKHYTLPIAQAVALHACLMGFFGAAIALFRSDASTAMVVARVATVLVTGALAVGFAQVLPQALEELLKVLTRDVSKVALPPGYWLRRLAEPIFHSQTYERVFAPLIADLEHEHAEALSKGQTWRARWIVVRSYVDFALTAVAHVASRVREALKDVNRAA